MSVAAEAIGSLIPKSLDEVIKANRDRFSLQLADAHRLAKLPRMIDVLDRSMQEKATINSYWIIEVIDAEHGSEFFLLGYKRDAFISSNIRAIDWDSGLVLTRNSLYRLGTQGVGGPDFHALMHVCASFTRWGWGEFMGILPVFY